MLQHIVFTKDTNLNDLLLHAYSFRFTETPRCIQEESSIRNAVDATPREGFTNISLLTPEKYGVGVKLCASCSFEGTGCPEIILVEDVEQCDDNALRYGACFEVVLYQNGVNVWRHYADEHHHCSWHKRLGVEFPVDEHAIHQLSVEVGKDGLFFSVDDRKTFLRTEDLPKSFHVGITLCEGVVRFYDLKIITSVL